VSSSVFCLLPSSVFFLQLELIDNMRLAEENKRLHEEAVHERAQQLVEASRSEADAAIQVRK
jgi:hypothetical protein